MSEAKLKITIEKTLPFNEEEHNRDKIIEFYKKVFEEDPYEFLTNWGETEIDITGEIV
jgi:hypothetical protein